MGLATQSEERTSVRKYVMTKTVWRLLADCSTYATPVGVNQK